MKNLIIGLVLVLAIVSARPPLEECLEQAGNLIETAGHAFEEASAGSRAQVLPAVKDIFPAEDAALSACRKVNLDNAEYLNRSDPQYNGNRKCLATMIDLAHAADRLVGYQIKKDWRNYAVEAISTYKRAQTYESDCKYNYTYSYNYTGWNGTVYTQSYSYIRTREFIQDQEYDRRTPTCKAAKAELELRATNLERVQRGGWTTFDIGQYLIYFGRCVAQLANMLSDCSPR